MARARSSRGFPARSRRLTSWVLGPEANDVGASANATVLWTQTTVTTEPITVIRTRGVCQLYLTAASAIGDGFAGALGIGIVSDQAAAAGAASVPDPKSEVDWDGWLWHSFFDLRVLSTTLADGVNASVASVRIEIDSKAMRKWDESMTMIGVLGAVESGTAVMEMQADCRMLIKV